MEIKTGDLVRECVFKAKPNNGDKEVCRYGIVIGEFKINYPREVIVDRMLKVCWSASPEFPVSSNIYSCFVNEKQLEVIS
tara:strand:- start:1042 stop:1281 length:240 start_codon:yes stop_codon:yes gene_type:complete